MSRHFDIDSIRRFFQFHHRRQKAARQIAALPPSAFVVSFPKCGRTWLLVMIGHYVVNRYGLPQDDLLNLGDFHKTVPELPPIQFKHDDKPDRRAAEELIATKAAYKKHKVIFLVRDPRDVLVSKYYSLKYREDTYSGSLSEFIREPRGSLSSIVRYYNIWFDQRNVPNKFLLLRYEDLHAHADQKLAEVLRFLGIREVSEDHVQGAVHFGRFENMRVYEDERRFNRPMLWPTRPGEFRSYKTRKGTVGDYRNELSEDDIRYVDDYLRQHLHRAFGYSLGQVVA
jgi:hypothetical protein